MSPPSAAPAGCNQTWHLRGIDLFADVPEAEVERLAATLGTRSYRAGEPIMAPDDAGDTVYIVLGGTVRLFHRAPDGREVTVATLGRGRPFGVASLLGEPAQPQLWAEAATGAVVCLASGDDFRDLLLRYPDVMIRMTPLVIARLIEAEEQLDRLAVGGVRARLAGLLARQARDAGEPAAGGRRRLAQPPTHADLAHQIGASRETVTRQLAALEADGLIGREGRAILVDVVALEADEAGSDR